MIAQKSRSQNIDNQHIKFQHFAAATNAETLRLGD